MARSKFPLLLLYRQTLTLHQLCHVADRNRGADGIARNVLVRQCAITDCPGTMAEVMDRLKFQDSRLAKNYFTSKPMVEYLKEPFNFNANGK